MWKEELNKNLGRRKAEITFDPHLFDRKEYWNLELDKIEETVRGGKIFDEKCEQPNKLCFETTEFHQFLIGGMSSARKPPINGGIPSIKNHLKVKLMESCHPSLMGGF
jgi:hypothetical protein